MEKARSLYDIPLHELLERKVWEFDLDEGNYAPEQDETWVYPVYRLPINCLRNRVIVTAVMLANGESVVAMLGNVHLGNPRRTREFIALSLEKNGAWFHLARYFDAEYEDYGPKDLACFLGLSVEEVFPIHYDISNLAVGADEVLRGEVHAEPVERLTQKERFSLLFGH